MARSTRLKLLAAVGVVLLAAVLMLLRHPAGDGHEAAPKKIVWNISVWGPPRAVSRGLERAKVLMEQASGGRMEMKIHYGSTLTSEKETLDAIKIGVVEGSFVCVGYHPGKLPLATVLELPFVMGDNLEHNVAVQDAVFKHPLIEAELAQRWNAKYFLLLALPHQELMGNRRLASVGDLRGVRMRITGGNASVMEQFGAVATNVPPPETYTALERGTLDVVGLPWTYALAAYRIHEVSRYTTDGLALTGFACLVAVSLDAWNALPPELQRELPRIQEENNRALLEAYRKADEEFLPIFRKTLEVVRFPPQERAKLIARSEPVWQQWAAARDAEGMAGTQMLEFVKAQVARYGP